MNRPEHHRDDSREEGAVQEDRDEHGAIGPGTDHHGQLDIAAAERAERKGADQQYESKASACGSVEQAGIAVSPPLRSGG
jgi:hypothetical protein